MLIKLWKWFKKMKYDSKCKSLMKLIVKSEKLNRDCRQKFRRIMRAFNKQRLKIVY